MNSLLSKRASDLTLKDLEKNVRASFISYTKDGWRDGTKPNLTFPKGSKTYSNVKGVKFNLITG
jgi:hypothetical protein